MCGIAGFWCKDGSPKGAADLAPALDRLRHRGPDDEGYLVVDSKTRHVTPLAGPETASGVALSGFDSHPKTNGDLVLGHRRLSILDLSPRGHQPMATPDGKCWIIFNGEIYNYIELREELAANGEAFETETDTEVVLHAWQVWGEECLHRFNGDWAFALLDLRDEPQLFLARDRWGVKPLFYTETGDAFWFASEAKALVGHAVPFAPARRAVARFLQSGEIPPAKESGTFFEGIRQLAPGECMRVGPGELEKWRWYDLRGEAEPVETPAADRAVAEMSDHLERAVRIRLRSDVPVGSCLSGGVDSSAVVGTMRTLLDDEPVHTFSAVYRKKGPFNEAEWIDKVVAHTRSEAHPTYPDDASLADEFDKLVWHQDEPFSGPSIFAQWCVMQEARRAGVTVLLDGQAADELLAGYQPGTHREHQLELLGSGRFAACLRAIRDRRKATGMRLRELIRELGEILVHGPEGRREPQTAALGIRDRIAAEFFHKATLDPAEIERKIADDCQKLTRWKSDLGKKDNAGRKNLAAKIAKKRRQIASNRLKRLRLTGRGRLRVAWERLRGRFGHGLRERLLDQTTSSNLAHLLRYEDRNSMAFSIEARVPFTDCELVEWAFRRGNEFKIHKGWTKWVLRTAAGGKVPDAILWRRDKVGFETPESQFVRQLLESRSQRLLDSQFLGEFLDQDVVHETCRRVATDDGSDDEVRAVWRWLVLEAWERLFGAS